MIFNKAKGKSSFRRRMRGEGAKEGKNHWGLGVILFRGEKKIRGLWPILLCRGGASMHPGEGRKTCISGDVEGEEGSGERRTKEKGPSLDRRAVPLSQEILLSSVLRWGKVKGRRGPGRIGQKRGVAVGEKRGKGSRSGRGGGG